MNREFDEILSIPKRPPSQKDVYEKRYNRILEAMSWPEGTYEDKVYTTYYKGDSYEVRLGKPGKESLDTYKGKKNPYDMRPEIFKDGKNLNLAATFGDIIYDLEEVAKKEKYCVELLAALMFRSAFLLDHEVANSDKNNPIYRYSPKQEVIDYITERIPEIYGVPPIIFLQYLDAIALNEDVKYYYKNFDLSKKNTGGRNNYLTYVLLTTVITGDIPVSVIAAKLLRTNVAAIGISQALAVLPHVKSNK